MESVLIIGGGGFIGRNLVNELADNYRVIVADLQHIAFISDRSNVSFIGFDFVHTEDFAPILQGIDIVFHLVSTILPEDGTDGIISDIENNLFPTIRLLDALVKKKIKRLYFLSSGGTVYGEGVNERLNSLEQKTLPICKYGYIKDTTEKLLEVYHVMHGLNYMVIRLSNPYGDKARQNQRQGLIPILAGCVIRDEEFTIWGDGEAIRDYIYIEDAINAVQSLMVYEGEERIFNVGGGKGHSILDVVHLIEKRLGYTYNKLHFQPARKCDVKRNILDISLIQSCTGWKPETTLEDGIERLLIQFGISEIIK